MERIDEYFCLIDEKDVIMECKALGPRENKDYILYRDKSFAEDEMHVNTYYEKQGDKYKIFYSLNSFGYDRKVPEDYDGRSFTELQNLAYNAWMDGAK